MEHVITEQMIEDYRQSLIKEEKSVATVQKYLHDLGVFRDFAGEKPIDKETMIRYKEYLLRNYLTSSINSMLAGVNGFLKFFGWYDCVVKTIKSQKGLFRREDRELSREEYKKLLAVAKAAGKMRLWHILQTICSTGIRVSELRFITVEAVKAGYADVHLKGKNRRIILPQKLIALLKEYIRENGIIKRSVFVTRGGRPVDRSNLYHEIQKLCKIADIAGSKGFPHNFRHLFACIYYEQEKNLANLADVLGHSNMNTTRIYVRSGWKKQVQILDEMDLVAVTAA
ncbi:MAG: tyrosine-type recombinase/integrase [Clostridiales bacterium]|nr:tyrosine-type recombinase/integrase [Clostridiales bacterium]